MCGSAVLQVWPLRVSERVLLWKERFRDVCRLGMQITRKRKVLRRHAMAWVELHRRLVRLCM